VILLNKIKIALFTAFKPLRPGAEEIVIPLIKKSIDFLKELGKVFVYEDIVTTQNEGRNAAKELLLNNPEVFVVLVFGGTERIIKSTFININLPIILLTFDHANSLAAALEIMPRLRELGKDIKIFFVERFDNKLKKDFENFLLIRKAAMKLKETTLGIFGSLSPWLISSTSDYRLLEDKFGLKIRHIDLLRLYNEYKRINLSEAEKITKQILSNVRKLKEPSIKDVTDAIRLYIALKKIVKEENLNVLTIKCFGIIPVLNNTMCLALSKLIDDGIIAGCEGDIDTTLSMIILNYLTNKPTWMANPVSLNYKDNKITLAHCTIAMNLISNSKDIILRSHFESGKGVAIQGPVNKGDVTLIRLGGSRLDKMLICLGDIVNSNMCNEYMCRTQVEIKLKGKLEEFLNKSMGNHLALVQGNLVEKLKELCNLFQIKPIIIY
jgi:L-fucose isomerase-like protein